MACEPLGAWATGQLSSSQKETHAHRASLGILLAAFAAYARAGWSGELRESEAEEADWRRDLWRPQPANEGWGKKGVLAKLSCSSQCPAILGIRILCLVLSFSFPAKSEAELETEDDRGSSRCGLLNRRVYACASACV